MGINKYDNLTLSAYNPMSFQEIAMVPMYKRKMHDEELAKQELIRSGLAKVDPLDVHYNKALQLKQSIESEIDNSANDLATHGFNNDMIGKTIALNRRFQDLTAPTGELGQINTAKIIYNANQKEFLDSAEKQKIGSVQALAKWKEKTAKYTGFDENGKISNVDKQGVSAFQDYEESAAKAHALLGEKINSEKQRGVHFVNQELPDGSSMIVAKSNSGAIMHSDNIDNIISGMKAFSDNWLNPNGEGYKYAKDAGLNITSDRVANTFNSMRKQSDLDQSNEAVQFLPKANKESDPKDKSTYSDAAQDPNSVVNLHKDVKDIDFNKIGTKETSAAYAISQSRESLKFGHGHVKKNPGKPYSYEDILSPLQQGLYIVAYNRLVKSGRLSKNADKNDTNVAKKIGFYIKEHMKFPTIASDIIRPDVSPEAELFAGILNKKDANGRYAALEQDVRTNGKQAPLREMVDSDTGEKVKLSSGDKLEYLGYDSPINYSGYNFNNKLENNVMAHRGQILDENGNFVRNVAISRTDNEMKTPQFKQMYEINHIYRNAVNNLGEWRNPTGKYSGSKQVQNYLVKYNDDGTFQLKDKKSGQTSEKMDNETFNLNMRQILSN